MKAASRFLSAAMAAALHVGLAVPGAIAVQLAFVSAVEAAVVDRIEVRGNQRVGEETIRTHVGIDPGASFDTADVNEGVKRLFATGLFADVDIRQAGNALIVTVDEYPIVNRVLFQGNQKIKDANLAQTTQLQSRRPYSERVADNDVETIRQAYQRIGRDDATINVSTQELDGNRVNVVFEIQEGGRTKIATITFAGNDAFSDRRLRDVISTKRSNIFSFLFRNDVYDDSRIRADEEALRRFYFDRGYADFRVVSSNAQLNEETNEYTITFTVDEGERYTFGDVSIESTLEGIDTETLRSQIETREGSVYSATNVENTIINLTESVAGRGYAFAEVTPRGDRNFDTREISVVYSIDEGQRSYIERIEIRGNTRTRDYVIRREFDVSEGDAFNQVLIQRAKKRLENLDFFEAVNVSTQPGSASDQVILVVEVAEKPTGEFSIGAGYSTGESATSGSGFSVEGSITERNFLGRGQYIRVSAAGGEDSRDYQLSFTEPYFLGRRISAGFDIFRRSRDYTTYERETTGATVRFGLPISEALTSQFAYHLTTEDYAYRGNVAGDCPDTNSNVCPVAPAIQTAIDDGNWVKSSVSNSLIYNTLDNNQNPRDGIYANFTTEVAGLGGDAKFVRVTGRGNYYRTLSEEMDLVGLLAVGGGHVEAYDGTLRVFDHFESESRIIRGFDYNGMGPYDPATGDHLGGTTYFHATAEAQFPLPVVPQSFGMRGALFADAATLYGSDISGANGTDMEWRASVGAGLIWASPFGPLRIDYAIPVAKEPTDDVQNFNFGISSRF